MTGPMSAVWAEHIVPAPAGPAAADRLRDLVHRTGGTVLTTYVAELAYEIPSVGDGAPLRRVVQWVPAVVDPDAVDRVDELMVAPVNRETTVEWCEAVYGPAGGGGWPCPLAAVAVPLVAADGDPCPFGCVSGLVPSP